MHKCSHGNGLKASGNHESKRLMWVEDIKIRGFQQCSHIKSVLMQEFMFLNWMFAMEPDMEQKKGIYEGFPVFCESHALFSF